MVEIDEKLNATVAYVDNDPVREIVLNKLQALGFSEDAVNIVVDSTKKTMPTANTAYGGDNSEVVFYRILTYYNPSEPPMYKR